jgi:hypothetical protein
LEASNGDSEATACNVVDLKNELTSCRKKCNEYEVELENIRRGKKKSEKIIYIRK